VGSVRDRGLQVDGGGQEVLTERPKLMSDSVTAAASAPTRIARSLGPERRPGLRGTNHDPSGWVRPASQRLRPRHARLRPA